MFFLGNLRAACMHKASTLRSTLVVFYCFSSCLFTFCFSLFLLLFFTSLPLRKQYWSSSGFRRKTFGDFSPLNVTPTVMSQDVKILGLPPGMCYTPTDVLPPRDVTPPFDLLPPWMMLPSYILVTPPPQMLPPTLLPPWMLPPSDLSTPPHG